MDVYTLNAESVATLAHMASVAADNGRPLRVAWDGGLKVKLGEGMWSVPLTHDLPDTRREADAQAEVWDTDAYARGVVAGMLALADADGDADNVRPDPLSGEWADDITEDDIWRSVTGTDPDLHPLDVDRMAECYLSGYEAGAFGTEYAHVAPTTDDVWRAVAIGKGIDAGVLSPAARGMAWADVAAQVSEYVGERITSPESLIRYLAMR